jgi:hypothetical protein
MRFVVVEDDFTWYEVVSDELKDEYPGLVLCRYSCESAFIEAIKEIRLNPPDLFLIDMIIHFRDLNEGADAGLPKDYEKNSGRFEGGLRCAKLIRSVGLNTPIILYSVSPKPEAFDITILGKIVFEAKAASIRPWLDAIEKFVLKKN